MKGDDHIITHLNNLLSDELVAVNQYFLHSKIFNNWGLERLNKIEYQECVDELDHADLYAKRILFLEGMPTLRKFDPLNIKKNVEDILRADLSLEFHSIENLRKGIKYAGSIQDYVSRDIMIQILKDEEKHIDFLETELNLMIKVGMHNYIQSQLKK
ncbi:bacterioferritin [Candidatus Blochmanniella pennsylvanica str. BPEN]|uniref:Bacterioferritin n=1 Tax=Blochmanniella pennsylvanica (strain BPEN) TaxID=291272 RepID=Q493L0_BLOPB|nr:bacterioferritin [Candidatus Blochmannia pennsylvanicus]AAZ40830.1 bacterioferritin [Candidatus Blochmannia pennsylvanicus str. BPEN]UOY04602.1 bacterioferritin [Candidatus Blochmannia pennsylvanicus]